MVFWNKSPGAAVGNRVVLFTSPLLKDTTSSPLFLSRCIGMPGDTIRISNDGYRVNGRLIPHSPRSLNTYIVTQAAQEEVLAAQKKLNIPLREMKEEPFGISFNLTSFEEYQIREELGFKNSLPVFAVPAEPGVSNDMVAWDESEVTRIHRFVGIVGKHPVIILIEEEEICFPTVQE